MSVTDQNGWGEVERRARLHEAINHTLALNDLPLLTITCEDRLRGGIISAIAEIEAGHTHLALKDLRNCLNLLTHTKL